MILKLRSRQLWRTAEVVVDKRTILGCLSMTLLRRQALRPGEGPLTIRFADFRHCAVQASGFGELTIYALTSRLSASCTEAITASKFR